MDAREKQAVKENELNSTLEEHETETEEDNADINFEVRAEKLKAASANQVIVNDAVEQEVQEDHVVVTEQSEEVDHDASISIYDSQDRSNKQSIGAKIKETHEEEGSHLS
jgi:hypothetical protein